MAAFCLGTLVFLVYRDCTIPAVAQVEVWFGFELRGVWAARTAPLHYLLYAGAALAFWRSWPRVWPLAIGYSIYVAISHLIWNVINDTGAGLTAGLWQLALFLVPTLVLIRLAPRRQHERARWAGDDDAPHPRS